MSDTDGFISEVEEELRRDRARSLARRYGWIAALVVLAVVGGTAWNEYRKAQIEAAAEARGDAIAAALTEPTASARALALSGESGVVEAFLAAAEFQASGNIAQAVETLTGLAETPELKPLYRDLAQLKRLSIDTEMLSSDRSLIVSALAAPGAPYRTIAEEYLALDLVRAGDTEAAIAAFQALLQDADASQAQQQRIVQIIVALGGTPELATGLPGDTAVAPLE